MKNLKKITSGCLMVALFAFMTSFLFADSPQLILTGDLYYLKDGEYTLQIEDMNQFRALNGRKLGFKIKKIVEKGEGQKTVEEETVILGVRKESQSNNSNIIFNGIQAMLHPSADNKVLTFGVSDTTEAYKNFENLLTTTLVNKHENLLVEYYDNRVNGDAATTVKVLYKIGGHLEQSSSSSFVTLNSAGSSSSSSPVTDAKTTMQKKVNISSVLAELKKEQVKSAVVKLEKDFSTVIPKSLLSELMYDKYKDKEIVFEKYDDSILLFRWVMPINNISMCEKFNIDIKKSNEAVERCVAGNFSRYKIISFESKGILPAICDVTIPVDLTGFDTSNLRIYSVDVDKKTIEEKKMIFEFNNGMLKMKTGFGGNYIISDVRN